MQTDEEDVRQPLVIVEIDPAEESTLESQEKIDNEIAQSDSLPPRDLRKRLHRENAMQKTTTLSMENTGVSGELDQDFGLQHTGEFHDCIVLPAFDTMANSNAFYRRHPRYRKKNSEDKKEDDDEQDDSEDENDSSDDNQVLKNWTQDGHMTIADRNERIDDKFTGKSIIILSNSTDDVPPTIGFPLFDFGLNPLTQSHTPGIYNYNYVDNDIAAIRKITSSPVSNDNDSLTTEEGVIITEEINEPELDDKVQINGKDEIKYNGVNLISDDDESEKIEEDDDKILEDHMTKPLKLFNGSVTPQSEEKVIKCDLGNLSSFFDQQPIFNLPASITTNAPLSSPVSIKLLENNLLNVVFGNGSSIPITIMQNIPTKSESLLYTSGNYHQRLDEGEEKLKKN